MVMHLVNCRVKTETHICQTPQFIYLLYGAFIRVIKRSFKEEKLGLGRGGKSGGVVVEPASSQERLNHESRG